jgi:hypothetical protein
MHARGGGGESQPAASHLPTSESCKKSDFFCAQVEAHKRMITHFTKQLEKAEQNS